MNKKKIFYKMNILFRYLKNEEINRAVKKRIEKNTRTQNNLYDNRLDNNYKILVAPPIPKKNKNIKSKTKQTYKKNYKN